MKLFSKLVDFCDSIKVENYPNGSEILGTMNFQVFIDKRGERIHRTLTTVTGRVCQTRKTDYFQKVKLCKDEESGKVWIVGLRKNQIILLSGTFRDMIVIHENEKRFSEFVGELC